MGKSDRDIYLTIKARDKRRAEEEKEREKNECRFQGKADL